MADIVENLRSLSRYEHADLSVGDEAADEIEGLREKVRLAELSASHSADVAALAIEDMKKAEARLANLEAVAEAALDLAKAFKGDPCWLDHHGNCQAHFLEDDCSVGRLEKALSALNGEKDDG